MNLLRFLLVFSLFLSFSCRDKEAVGESEFKESIVKLPENFYKRFKGTLGNDEIIMNVIKDDTVFYGSFYKTSENITYFLQNGKIDTRGNINVKKYSSNQYLDSPILSTLEMKFFNDSVMTGILKDTTGKESGKIKLIENYENAYKINVKEFKKTEVSDSVKAEFSHLIPEVLIPNNKNLEEKINKLIISEVYYVKFDEDKFDAETEMKEFIKTFKQFSKEDIPYKTDWTNIRNFDVLLNENNLLSLSFSGYEFTGGAHGLPYVTSFTVNMSDGKIVKIDDIINKDSKGRIPQLIYKNLKKETGLSDEELLNELSIVNYKSPEKIPISTNMIVLKDGIRFDYGAYSLGSYAFGSHFILIPKQELKGILKDSFIF